ncbi:MAG: tRNA (adenosine(37)-N6)-threonylcarbamoyltransferase complex ATPase subunit type 1 TsaE [Microbacter sp.]
MNRSIASMDELPSVAAQILSMLKSHKIVAFYGSMGVGKTTLINALCQTLGVTDTINSPTFSIVNQYDAENGEPIYHFDFYRINKIEEAFDFGYEDYFFSGNYCFIEWPEKIESLLPSDTLKVFMTEMEDGTRMIEIPDQK